MGALLALLVFLIALFTALGVVSGEHLLWWLIAGLALALMLGSAWPPVWWTRFRRPQPPR